MKKGKNYRATCETRDKEKTYDIAEAMTFVKTGAKAKFDESVEVHVKLAIDPKRGDQAIRGTVSLPHGTGKATRIAVITDTKAEDAKAAGADIIGAQDLVDDIKAGKIPDVDVIVATPEMMPKLAAAAKVLGPRGLMPSPKTETVTPDVTRIVGELKQGKENIKNDKGGIVHQVIGKTSFDEDKLVENYIAFITAIRDLKTDAHKSALIASVTTCSTMGPSVKVKA